MSVDLRRQQHLAALWATALLAPHGDGPRKGGLNKGCLTPTWLASRGQRASLPSGKKNKRKKKTASLKSSMQLDIDIAALNEVRFAEQGSLTEDGAGNTFFRSGKNKDKSRLSGVGFMI